MANTKCAIADEWMVTLVKCGGDAAATKYHIISPGALGHIGAN